jgi:regulator of sigma E protease
MSNFAQYLGTTRDLALVILGFGLIVFLHELGHFIAARWAKIRVLAFAVGFGPALFSYRKGMGIQSGSSEAKYLELLKAKAQGQVTDVRGVDINSISPTEYRFNILPLGGYVKMLGQDDINPLAVSDAPDSYQNCKPWKRMVVISAGVITNVITAAVLFIFVFMVGLKVEPPKIGGVQVGSPAATAIATNAAAAGVTEPGLRPGDELLTVDDRRPHSFNDLVLGTAMAEKGHDLSLTVKRPGVAVPLVFSIRPSADAQTGLLSIGVEPSRSGEVLETKTDDARQELIALMDRGHLTGVEPGMRLVRVGDNTDKPDGNSLEEAIRHSGGKPIEAEFAADGGKHAQVTITPRPQMMVDFAPRPGGTIAPVEHILGLTPVMTVTTPPPTSKDDLTKKVGLEYGDVFARIGNTEYPDASQGMAEVKARRGDKVTMVVLRKGDDGALHEVELPSVPVSSKGQVGFYIGSKTPEGLIVSIPPTLRHPEAKEPFTTAASRIIVTPGTKIVAVGGLGGTPVSDMATLRAALLAATSDAAAHKTDATVQLAIQRPVAGSAWSKSPVEVIDWKLTADDVASLHALGWESPEIQVPFESEQMIRVAKNPVEAVQMGLAETRRVMLTTYITFARLAQGTVKVEHLKGPVGIAHLGTLVAEKGLIWLLFFMALISINLAVINFLPLPIVDGGQFLFLVYEQIRGKPVPPGVQNAVTMAGLVLIGCVFLVVTYNDITHLFGL